MFSSGAGNYLGSCGTKALAAGRRRLATGQQSRDPTHVPIPPGGGGAGAAGGAEPGKFVSRVRRPGAPAVVAQVPSSFVEMELPAVNLKAILLVHWLLAIWGCIVFPGAYAWSNFTILALGVWAVAQRDSIDAISMFLGGLVVTIFLDIIHISIFYPRTSLLDTERFSAGMAIVSALLKPVSCCFVYQMHRERRAFLGPSQDHSAYQTIDSPEAPADLESRAHVPQGY